MPPGPTPAPQVPPSCRTASFHAGVVLAKDLASLNRPSFASAPLLQKKIFPGPISRAKACASRPCASW